MPTPERTGRADQDGVDAPTVTARRLSETRTVFTEEDNPDGWIATDLTVPLDE